ncbi:hypothetical protein EYZ11_006948 [Aspergillus tanneri]|uniref:Uncharacterized protein n=1 Tax=Aspergillus tanneri TaxID=1220188 RepID=A0A4S3JER4_9EURO|nr:uncharacterized protein ATNIH1004_011537 [Aspergillus tanneri]KAA8642592.1 hypothetical protein ATNIH1004_011537 [Aspergillus tanneri]THC93595.1 hypothetical protein EYZ11_006948 [Aspergillus tanneri]
MANIADIREKIFENKDAQRIVIKLHTEKLDSQDYRASAYKIVNEIFPNWERDNRILFLAIEIWGDRTYMAIDVNNYDYKFETAHKTKTILPVYVLRQHRKRGWAIIRWPQEDKPLATKLADLHNVNGFAATPFLENYNTRIVHDQPREFPVGSP